jgi:hypothetical protein
MDIIYYLLTNECKLVLKIMPDRYLTMNNMYV